MEVMVNPILWSFYFHIKNEINILIKNKTHKKESSNYW